MSKLCHFSGLFDSDLHGPLAQVAGLRMSDERAVVNVSPDFPRELQILLSLYNIEPVVDGVEPVTGREKEEWRGKEIALVDILGRYFPATRKVDIYSRVIHSVSVSLGIDERVLTDIVLAHEIGHAVTHFAVDEDGTIWERFDSASTEDQELLAQLLPFILFRQLRMSDHVAAMEKLRKTQASKYNTYHKHEKDSLSFVRQLVRQLRLKVVTS